AEDGDLPELDGVSGRREGDNGAVRAPGGRSSELVGRAPELAALSRFLDAVAQGSAAVVLEGDAGIGKTALLAAGTALADERGDRRRAVARSSVRGGSAVCSSPSRDGACGVAGSATRPRERSSVRPR